MEEEAQTRTATCRGSLTEALPTEPELFGLLGSQQRLT